jgi:hypothetical protein
VKRKSLRQILGSPKKEDHHEHDQPEFVRVPSSGGFHLCEADCSHVEGALVPVCNCGTALAPVVTNGGPRLIIRALVCPHGCGGASVVCGAVLRPGDEVNGEEAAAVQ